MHQRSKTVSSSELLRTRYDTDISFIDPSNIAKMKPLLFVESLNTLGTLDDQNIKYLQYTAVISLEKLHSLLNQCLRIYFLYEAIEKTLNMLLSPKSVVKVITILKMLYNGDFYYHLKQNIIVNNRTTKINTKIVIASLIVYCTNRLNFEDIKLTLSVFSMQEQEDETIGIRRDENLILGMLKKLDKTISMPFLKDWLTYNTFELKNVLLGHEFLYLACYASNRDYLLKRIKEINFKNIRMKDSKLYLIQPLQEIYGTPDFKIQQLLIGQMFKRQKKQEKDLKVQQSTVPAPKKVSRRKPISELKSILRQMSTYTEISQCLYHNQQKSGKLKKCIRKMRSTTARFDSVTPILSSATLNNRQSTARDNITFMLTNPTTTRSRIHKPKSKRQDFDLRKHKTQSLHMSQMLL